METLENRPCRSLVQDATVESPNSLWRAIEQAVNQIEDKCLRGIAPDDEAPFCRTRLVLASLTLCYALQIYHSHEVAKLVARDLYSSCLGEGDLPDAAALRRFRAENRSVIHRCLSAALRFQAEQKVSSGFVTGVHLPHITEEARRRVTMAMFVDSVEFDWPAPTPPRAARGPTRRAAD